MSCSARVILLTTLGDTAFSDTLMIAEGAEGAEGDGGTEGEGVVVGVVVTSEALRYQSAMHIAQDVLLVKDVLPSGQTAHHTTPSSVVRFLPASHSEQRRVRDSSTEDISKHLHS